MISNINSTEPMEEIRIVGEFYDSNNNLIGVETTFPELAIVPLDQSSLSRSLRLLQTVRLIIIDS
jgi:hypothetical protein